MVDKQPLTEAEQAYAFARFLLLARFTTHKRLFDAMKIDGGLDDILRAGVAATTGTYGEYIDLGSILDDIGRHTHTHFPDETDQAIDRLKKLIESAG